MSDITTLAAKMKSAAYQSALARKCAVGMEVAAESFDFIELSTPANILALVEALEAAGRRWAAQDDHINQQADRIEWLEQTNAGLGKALGAAKSRIAELEARTLTVKLPDCDLGAVQHMSGGSDDYCNGFVDGAQNAIKALTESSNDACIKLQIEE